MNKLFINGSDVTDDVQEGLTELTIELGLNTSTKTIGKTLSSNITVKDFAYRTLKDLFFKTCDSWQNTAKSVFKTDICGGIDVECEVTSEGLDWCPEKEEISFNLKSSDEVSKAYSRLDSEYIYENGFVETVEIPIMYYADQPNWMQWALLLLTFPLRVALNIISGAINALCQAATLGIGGILGYCDLDLANAVFKDFDTWITGVGRWTVAPLVREMISYQCQAVGLSFSSSILNDPGSSRYNLAMFCLTGGEHGSDITSKPRRVEVFYANAPVYTTIELLEQLKVVFAADYRIIDNVLYFERADYFDNLANITILNTKDYCLDDPYKISINTDEAVAYGAYEYIQDAYDSAGNSTLKVHYSDKVEFNKPFNPAQKGKKTRVIQFGASRFMFDVKLFNSSGFFNFDKYMDEFRDGPEGWVEENLWANEGKIRTNDLIVSGGTLSYEKLLVLEPNFKREDAQTIRKKYQSKDGKQYWIYNSPMHIQEEANYAELVKDFLFLDNPRLKKDRYKVSDFTVDCDCNLINVALADFQKICMQSPECKMIPGNIDIEFKEEGTRITFKNIRGLC